MKLQRIKAKILKDGRYVWYHFCYVPFDLFIKFDIAKNKDGLPTIHWIKKWAREDFNVDEESIKTYEDLEALKIVILREYKEKYPELYIESMTDNQGWVRVWYTNKLREELSK